MKSFYMIFTSEAGAPEPDAAPLIRLSALTAQGAQHEAKLHWNARHYWRVRRTRPRLTGYQVRDVVGNVIQSVTPTSR
jgi:hypothetical protein